MSSVKQKLKRKLERKSDSDSDEIVTKISKKQFRYSASGRVSLLKEVINVNPYDAAHGLSGKAWDDVRNNFLKAVPRAKSFNILTATVRNTVERMISRFRAGEIESLRKSGEEEDYTELDQLLTDLVELIDAVDEEKVKKEERNKKKELEKEMGILVRDAAMESLTTISGLSDKDQNYSRRRVSNEFTQLVEIFRESCDKDTSAQSLELHVRMEEAKARQMEAKNQAAQLEQLIKMQQVMLEKLLNNK
jgi:hypothetical protein